MSWWNKLKNKASQTYSAIDKNLANGLLPGGSENTFNPTEAILSVAASGPRPLVARTGLNLAGKLMPETFGPLADAGENAIRAVTGDRRDRNPSEFTSTTRSKLADAIDKAMPDTTMLKDKDGFTQVDYHHYNKDGSKHKGPIAYVGGRVWGRKNDDGTYELRSDENYDFNAGVERGNKKYKDNLDSATLDAIGRGDIVAAFSSIPDHLAYHTGAGSEGFNIGGKFSRPDIESTISETQNRPTPPAEPSPAMQSYEVAVGDTLTAIAAKHGLSIDEIARKNNISNVNMLDVGQQLKL